MAVDTTPVAVAVASSTPGPIEAGNPQVIDPGVAGASARREYERRHQARERRGRQQLGTLGVALARITGDPASTRVWKQGAEGEEKLARKLEACLHGKGVHLLHDRRVPGKRRANIDHIAIGPGGLTVIDAKTLHGQVRSQSVGGLFSPRHERLRVAGRDRTSLVKGVLGQREAVRAVLPGDRWAQLDVRCALCFVDTSGLPIFRRLKVEGVPVDGPRHIAKLAARPGPLDPGEVQSLVEVLASRLPAA